MTKLGAKRVHKVRTRGGGLKLRALRLETGNFAWSTEHVMRKSRIIGVVNALKVQFPEKMFTAILRFTTPRITNLSEPIPSSRAPSSRLMLILSVSGMSRMYVTDWTSLCNVAERPSDHIVRRPRHEEINQGCSRSSRGRSREEQGQSHL